MTLQQQKDLAHMVAIASFSGGVVIHFIVAVITHKRLMNMDYDELTAECEMDSLNQVTKPSIYMKKVLLVLTFIFSLGAVSCNNDCDGCEDENIDSSAEHDRQVKVDTVKVDTVKQLPVK